jgi:hypothetical protein
MCFDAFYLVINHKIANNSTTTKAGEKISADLKFLKFFDKRVTYFKNNQNLLNEATDF